MYRYLRSIPLWARASAVQPRTRLETVFAYSIIFHHLKALLFNIYHLSKASWHKFTTLSQNFRLPMSFFVKNCLLRLTFLCIFLVYEKLLDWCPMFLSRTAGLRLPGRPEAAARADRQHCKHQQQHLVGPIEIQRRRSI